MLTPHSLRIVRNRKGQVKKGANEIVNGVNFGSHGIRNGPNRSESTHISNQQAASGGRGTADRVSTTNSQSVREFIYTVLAILFILGVVATIFWPTITSPGIPSGVDTPSFLHTSKFAVDYFLKHHALPPTDPQWYSGFEYLHYAPPLIYIPIGLFYFLTNNIRLAGKMFQILAISLASLSMFWAVRKKHGVFSATIAGVLFSFAPWTFFQLGSPTKLLATILVPVCFYFTEKVLNNKKNLKAVLLLAISFLLALLSHPMMGLIFMAGMVVYSFVYTSLSKVVSVNRAFVVLGAAIAGVMLGGYFVIPYYLEKAGWTSIPLQELINYSHPLKAGLLYTGIPIIILGLYSAVRYRDARRIGLLGVGVLGWFLSLGVFGAGFIYEILPFLKMTYPGLWINLPIFAFVYLAATAVSFDQIKGAGRDLKKGIIVVLIIALALVAANPVDHFTWLNNMQSQLPDVIASYQLAALRDDGRVAPMKYPFGYLIWELTDRTQKHILEGHYFGLTRIGKYISWNYDAIDYGYIKYPLNMLAHHNVRYVIVNGNLLKSRQGYGKRFVRELETSGFRKTSTVVGYYGKIYDLYRKPEKSSYLIPLTERTLVVGEYAYTSAAVLSEEGKPLMAGSPFIDDYNEETLKHFKTLILYGFAYRNRSKAERLVHSFVRKGGRVVIDLYGAALYGLEENPNFLGITGYERIAKGAFDIEKANSQAAKYFAYERFDLPYELSNSGQTKKRLPEWRYTVYAGLDEPIARLKAEESTKGFISVAGFKHLKEGKVLFIGPNLFSHAYLTHNNGEIGKLIKALGRDGEATLTARPASSVQNSRQSNPRVYSESVEPARIRFNYTSRHDFPALVSYAYSAHWRAFVDGKEIKISNIEDLMFVNLPKGAHALTIVYSNTVIHTYAKGLSLLTVFLFAWLIYLDKKKGKREAKNHGVH